MDPANGDLFVADGYGNKHVAIFDKTGKFLRQWGSTGTGPGPVRSGRRRSTALCWRSCLNGLALRVRSTESPHPGLRQDGKPGSGPCRIVVCRGRPRSAPRTTSCSRRSSRPTPTSTACRAEVVWTVDQRLTEIDPGLVRAPRANGWVILPRCTRWRSISKGNINTGQTIDGGRRVQKFMLRGKMQENDFGEPSMGLPHYDPQPN